MDDSLETTSCSMYRYVLGSSWFPLSLGNVGTIRIPQKLEVVTLALLCGQVTSDIFATVFHFGCRNRSWFITHRLTCGMRILVTHNKP